MIGAMLRRRRFFLQGRIEAGSPSLSLRPTLSRFLSKCPFASARIIAAHFGIARDSVKMILAREVGLETFSRRWLPRQLSGAQKKSRVEFTRDVVQILEDHQELQFDGIATGDES
jgi:hypothetical protein